MTSFEINSPNLPSNNRYQRHQWIEILLSIIIFLILALFAYTEIFLKPYLGFSINWNTGMITSLDPVAEGKIQLNDQILRINGIPPEDINKSIHENPLIQTNPGEEWEILLIRDGEERIVRYPKPNQEELSFPHIISGDWILPFPFFAAGIITALFIRPRTATRFLLILFFYSFAIWISAGLISPTGYWKASTIMRVFVWLSLPIAFQLHWRFPIPFRFSKKWINVTSYSLIIIIAVLEILTPDAGNYFLIAFLITLISSFTILVIKYFKFKPYRKILLTIIFAYFLAVLPLALLGIKLLTGSVTVKRNFALLGLSAIPGFYFFIGYRIHMKRYNPKVLVAQRLFTLGVLLVFLMNFLIQSLPTAVNPLISSIVAFLTTIFISFTGFGALLIMPALADDQVNLFKTETYTLRMSANRASAFIIFLLVIGAITLTAMFFITSRIDSSIAASFLATLLSLSLTVITILLYKPYRKYFNRIILGIRRSPDELIRGYAHSIITSLDWDSLAILIKEEILPSLLIRESVLFYIQDNSRIMTLFKTGLTNTVVSQMQADLSLHIKDLHNVAIPETITHKYPWVRVTLPLEINGVKKGFWFFGQRDPNNIYNTEFIKDLSSLANQTTLALLNIHQAELLQSLYSANVNRQEEEKATIARDLHDALLPSIGYLVELQENNRDIEEFEHAVQRINTMIRNIMSGLRPATLDLGLAIALEELADEPVAQIGGAINIKTHLAIPEPVAYPKNVELHLYRMVQQASQNALEHARAEEILIHGTLLPNSLDLHVEDNGIGFQLTGSPDLSGLISQQHFGLANIFERAKIINADVKIDSQLNQGTSIHIHWSLQNDPKTG